MKDNDELGDIRLPDNAFSELKEGEKYEPIMSPRKAYPEVNAWSVTWGLLMTMLFSAAAAYLGLRVAGFRGGNTHRDHRCRRVGSH